MKLCDYPQYLILLILLNLLQNLKTVRLEELARRFPSPIKLKSRVMKLQRFLSLKQFKIKTLYTNKEFILEVRLIYFLR